MSNKHINKLFILVVWISIEKPCSRISDLPPGPGGGEGGRGQLFINVVGVFPGKYKIGPYGI